MVLDNRMQGSSLFFFSDGLVLRKPNVMHSRARVRARNLAKRKGRHTGAGKRKGTREARMSSV